MDRCYHRFDKNFQWPSNASFDRSDGGNPPQFMNQYPSRAYLASFSDSNGVYTNDMALMQGSHYGSPSNSFTPDNFATSPSLPDSN